MQLIEICNKQLCTGCAACFNVCPKKAISMEFDEEGFLYPVINREICIECGLCQKTCPIINAKQDNPSQPISVYAGYINDIKVRKKSASGGAFPVFAQYYYSLKDGMVAAAMFDEHLKLCHTLSNEKKLLSKFQGSKYVQSEIGTIYEEILKQLQKGTQVLFVGTPCQVAGIKSFLRKDYDNLLTIDLVCHGVPSPKLFQSYLKQVGVSSKNKYRDFFFRKYGDSEYFHHSVSNKLGLLKQISPSKHSYICAYLKGWLHRESCYHCPFAAIPRQGDCTIADFWGVLSGKVAFSGDRTKGVSMIMINNQKGQDIFEHIKQFFYLEEKTLEDAKIDNHNLYIHDNRPEIRNTVYKELLSISPEDFMNKYKLRLPMPTPLMKRIISKIKRIISK